MKEIRLDPKLGSVTQLFATFCRELSSLQRDADNADFERQLHEFRNKASQATFSPPSFDELKLLFARNLAVDLVSLGYDFHFDRGRIVARRQNFLELPAQAQKELVRKSELVGRNAQLRDPAVADFVQSIERRRLTRKGWHSIFSVMRDGEELAAALRAVGDLSDETKRLQRLRKVVQPYLQFVEEGRDCDETGLPLQSIWRYFRHTWTNAYKSTPGRSVMILVRDAAAKNHPIIGIGALGSSISQQRGRDRWIGWDGDTVVESLIASPTTSAAKWLDAQFNAQLKSIYTDDLRAEGVCTSLDIVHPTDQVIGRLGREESKARERHRRFPNATSHKATQSDTNESIDWKAQARTHLFRSKRCEKLATLLSIRMTFAGAGFSRPTKACLQKALLRSDFLSAVRTLVRMVKAEHIGVDMMDITVCGAVAPYNALLGGKLICMLLASPETTQYYNQRYSKHVSVIASSVKGAAVIKSPNLVLLATTSLYGSGSSQYNRVRIPASAVGGRADSSLMYHKVDLSVGFGTYHISPETLRYAECILARKANGRTVNSIFGEGVNPRMRKIRDAVEEIDLPATELLQHQNARVVYGVALAHNFSDVLLGRTDQARYILPQSKPTVRSALIADYWRTRWLSNRIRSPEVLSAVAEHRLTYPVVHGARVPLPHADEDDVML
jgi:hypothetical protein